MVRNSYWDASAWCHIGHQLQLLDQLKHKEMIPVLQKRIKTCIYAKFLFSGNSDIETESTKTDINDFTLWKPQNESIHQPLVEYLKFNALTDEYLMAERLLKKKVDTKTYMIYKRRFIDGYSYEKIAEEFDVSNPRIKECLDKCYYFLIGRLDI